MIYKENIGSYRKRKGTVKWFIRDFDKLRLKYNGLDAAHVYASKWNCTYGNLVFMKPETNNLMKNIIKYFSHPYNVYTAVNDNNEILIEMPGAELMPKYYKCKTPEAFLSWQKHFLGKEPLTASLTDVRIYEGEECVHDGSTPAGMIANGTVTSETASENEPDFWDWCNHRDVLLGLTGNDFCEWEEQPNLSFTVDERLLEYARETGEAVGQIVMVNGRRCEVYITSVQSNQMDER